MNDLNKYRLSLTGAVIDQRLLAVPGKADASDLTALSVVVEGKQDAITDLDAIRSGAAAGATAYQKPAGGIPSTDMASGVQTSLGKADTAYQKPSGGIPSTDMASGVQTSLGKADTAYQLPSDGIPAADIASGVIPDVSNFITSSVDDLVNYYLKTETYSQAEVNSLIGAISGFTYEIYATLADVTSPSANILYLIGPTGSGSDQYEEYVWPDAQTGFTKIGDTSIDLSNYVTTTDLSTALASYVTSSALATELSGYVTLNTGQTLHSQKTFQEANALGISATGWSTGWYMNYNSRNLEFKHGSSSSPTINYVLGYNTGFYPGTDGGKDLGKSGNTWNDLYLSRNLVDGNGTTASAADVVAKANNGVTGPASSTANHVATFDGATGKVIKDSGYTIATSVPSGAVFTDSMPTISTAGTGNVVTDVSISGTTITQTKDVLVQMVLWDITFDDNTTMQLPVCYATAAL